MFSAFVYVPHSSVMVKYVDEISMTSMHLGETDIGLHQWHLSEKRHDSDGLTMFMTVV